MDQNVNHDRFLGVVAAVTAERQSGRLQITGPGTRGAFFFKSGKLVDAHMGPFSGFPAVNLAVSITAATFHFDSSIQPPANPTVIPLQERLLLRERFGIETIDLYVAENQGSASDGAGLPTVGSTEVSAPPEMQVTETSDAHQPIQKKSAAVNLRGRTNIRAIRRRAARNRVAGREENKRLAVDTSAKGKDESIAVAVGGEKDTTNSTDAKPPEQPTGELPANPKTDGPSEPAKPAWPHQPPTTGSSVVRRVLFGTLVIFTFLISAVCGYWLNSYFFRKPMVTTQPGIKPKESAIADVEQPVIEGALHGKEATLVTPEYPVSAKSKGVTGKVTVLVLVNKQGNVISARALNGDHLLRGAAVTAARKAKFSPEKLVGKQSKTSGTITFSFKL